MKHGFILPITFAILTFIGFSYYSYYKFIESHKQKLGVTTNYDSYMFAIQWPLGMCAPEGRSCYQRMKLTPKHASTIHGLWPGFRGQRPIPDCNDGKTIDVKDDGSALFIEMKKFWPSLKGPNNKFWNHEFNKHGYCYTERIKTKKYQPYFYKGLEILKDNDYTHLVVNAIGTHKGDYKISFNDLKTALENKLHGSVFQFQCVNSGSNQYLSEIRIQLDLNFRRISTPFKSNCNKGKSIIVPFDEH